MKLILTILSLLSLACIISAGPIASRDELAQQETTSDSNKDNEPLVRVRRCDGDDCEEACEEEVAEPVEEECEEEEPVKKHTVTVHEAEEDCEEPVEEECEEEEPVKKHTVTVHEAEEDCEEPAEEECEDESHGHVKGKGEDCNDDCPDDCEGGHGGGEEDC